MLSADLQIQARLLPFFYIKYIERKAISVADSPHFQIEHHSTVRVLCNAFFTVLIGSRRLINESVEVCAMS